MTRYDIRPAETYVGLVIHEKPDGEWVKWDDVELLVIKQAIVDEWIARYKMENLSQIQQATSNNSNTGE